MTGKEARETMERIAAGYIRMAEQAEARRSQMNQEPSGVANAELCPEAGHSFLRVKHHLVAIVFNPGVRADSICATNGSSSCASSISYFSITPSPTPDRQGPTVPGDDARLGPGLESSSVSP
jgi:hypothetical protein